MMNIKKKIRYIKFSDILSPIIFIIILPFSFVFRIINKLKKRELWLICEDGITARDNGYHFYKYIKDKHPNDYCFYVIDKNCSDYSKVKEYGNIIQFKSLKHWLYYMSANYNISIHKHGNPCQSFFYVIHVILKLYNNRVFLQHGVIKDDLPFVHYKNARFRMFVCSAKREYEFVRDNFGYPKGYVKNIGLARFDKLHNPNINNKQLLIMPTWRNWFGGNTIYDKDKELFKETDYYKNWNSLLNDIKFKNYIEKNNIIVYFYPHQHMQKFLSLFKTNSKNIKIIDNSDIDIQQLLIESAFLITDYSSVFMDFGYMNKPVIYFQFDENRFRKEHMPKGYFDYRNDGFGPIILDKDELVEKIINIVNNSYIDEEKYFKRRIDFFERRDCKNCERTYKCIMELRNK